MKHFRSVVSLLMVFVLCFGMIPCAFADEITTPTAPQSGEGSASEAVPPNTDQTPPPEESAAPPEESTEPPSEEATEPMEEDPTDETTLPEELDDLDSDDRLLGAEAYASTQKSIMLFDFADNGDYTTRLNYQVSCAYKPNGSGTTRTAYVKNMGWHFARYGGVAHADEPLYCIEPWRNYAASTSGNSVDRDVTLNGSGSTTGSNVWYALPSARREAIGLILLYSDQQWDHSISVTSVKKDSNPNVPLRVATQILIYEIVCGLRDPSSFNRNSSNECGTSGDVFYAAASDSVSGFSSCYNSLVSAIQSAKKIPSFCGSSSSNAPTIQLSGDTGSVYDSNGVLSAFSFSNGNGARFSKSGNTLNITKTGDISESTVFTATRYLPSASNSSYNIWYMSGSSYQTTISLYNAGSNGLNAYFKIKAPSLGNISLTKTTEDGTNLSGWKFGIYSDSACTKLVSGPYTTNSSGKLSVTGLNAGTYYVKELGNTDSSIDALYSCASTNPQRVTIASGQTASVSFYNKRNTGSVQLVNMIQNLSNNVILPLAGAILAVVMTLELIQLITDRNNLNDVDTWMFFKWVFKSAAAVLIVSNTWTIVMGIFDAAQSVVNGAAGVMIGNTSIDISSVVTDLESRLIEMDVGPLLGLWFQSLFVGICTWAITICIFIVIYGRMIEVYLVTSVAPIPMATMANREWGQMGQNYLRTLLALGFQAFLIMVCVAIYSVLVQNISVSTDISTAIWTCMGYTVLLCFCLFKTSSLARSVFNAH